MLHKVVVQERVPTIFGAYEPVEKYLEQLCKLDPRETPREQSLAPVDALLLSLFLDYQATSSVVVDLASQSTRGVTTLLCSTVGSVKVVHELLSSSAKKSGYVQKRERFLEDRDVTCLDRIQTAEANPESVGWSSLTKSLQADASVVFVLHADGCSGEKLVQQIHDCLQAVPHASCVVLGLGQFGACPSLARLTELQSRDKSLCVRLCRELESAFVPSRLGVVYRESADASATVLDRIGQLYQSNFDYLETVGRLTKQAIERSPDHGTESNSDSELLQLTSTISTEELEKLQEELKALKASSSYKLGSFVQRFCQRLAPPTSLRHRVLRKSYRALQILRREGVRGIARRVRSRNQTPTV